jgi:hypothetical protein
VTGVLRRPSWEAVRRIRASELEKPDKKGLKLTGNGAVKAIHPARIQDGRLPEHVSAAASRSGGEAGAD